MTIDHKRLRALHLVTIDHDEPLTPAERETLRVLIGADYADAVTANLIEAGAAKAIRILLRTLMAQVAGPSTDLPPGKIKLHPSERRALQDFCLTHGDLTAAVLLDMSLETLCKAVAGGALQLTTRIRLLKMLMLAQATFHPRRDDDE